MNTKPYICLIVFLFCGGCPNPDFGPTTEELKRGTIVVIIIDSLRHPAVNVRVSIRGTPTVDTLMIASQITDSQGKVVFAGLPAWHPDYPPFWTSQESSAGYFDYEIWTNYYVLDSKGYRLMIGQQRVHITHSPFEITIEIPEGAQLWNVR